MSVWSWLASFDSSQLLSALGAQATAAAILAVVVATIAWRWRQPAVVHVLWLVVLVKLVVPAPFAWHVLPAWPATDLAGIDAMAVETRATDHRPWAEASHASPGSSSYGGAPGTSPAAARSATTPVAVSSLPGSRPWWHGWSGPGIALTLVLAGGLLLLALTAIRWRRFTRWLAIAAPAPAALVERVAVLARTIGLETPPAVRMMPGSLSPMVWRRFRGTELLVPTGLTERLRGPQLDAVLAHELAHVKRGDHWVRWLELAAGVLFWWCPVLWWARRALHRAEERACDAWVVSVLPGARRAYADGLLETLQWLNEGEDRSPVLVTGMSPKHDLKERLTMILTKTTPTSMTRVQRVLLTLAALAVLAILPTTGRVDAEGPAPAGAIPVEIEERKLEALEHEAHARAQELERKAHAIEKQSMELNRRMAELEAKREALEMERDQLEVEHDRERLEVEAVALERSGQAAEASALRERLATELAERKAQHAFRLQERLLEKERRQAEQSLYRAALEAREAALRGDGKQSEALERQAEEMRRQVEQREQAFQEQMVELERRQMAHHAQRIETERRAASEAGQAREVVELERELRRVKKHERRVQARHEQERVARDLSRRAAELEAAAERAGGDQRKTEELYREAERLRRDEERLMQRELIREQRARQSDIVEELEERLFELRAHRDEVDGEEATALDQAIAMLERDLDALRAVREDNG